MKALVCKFDFFSFVFSFLFVPVLLVCAVCTCVFLLKPLIAFWKNTGCAGFCCAVLCHDLAVLFDDRVGNHIACCVLHRVTRGRG